MIGIIDDFGRALLSVLLRSSRDDFAEPLDVWIDTGFTDSEWAPSIPSAF